MRLPGGWEVRDGEARRLDCVLLPGVVEAYKGERKAEIRSSMAIFVDVVDALARKVVPVAVSKHVEDTVLLWKILVSWLQQECKAEVFEGLSNCEGASALERLRSARNQIQHKRSIATSDIMDTVHGVNALFHVKPPYLSLDEQAHLEVQAYTFTTACNAMHCNVFLRSVKTEACGADEGRAMPSGVGALATSVAQLQLSDQASSHGGAHLQGDASPFSVPSSASALVPRPTLNTAPGVTPLPLLPSYSSAPAPVLAGVPCTVDELRRTQFVPLPDTLTAEVVSASFRDLKVTHKAALKRRKLWIHTGKYRGRVCSFMMWNGSSTYCFFEPEGKRAIASSHTVSVLRDDVH